MRKPLIIIIILTLMAITITVFVPPYIDKKTNTVLYKEPIQISDAARQLYDSLPFIADFHSDALLWDRNLLKKNDAGAVDIPRMQQSNMALQAFTIVTKTPYGLNFNSNSADAFDIQQPSIFCRPALCHPGSICLSAYLYSAGHCTKQLKNRKVSFGLFPAKKNWNHLSATDNRMRH